MSTKAEKAKLQKRINEISAIKAEAEDLVEILGEAEDWEDLEDEDGFDELLNESEGRVESILASIKGLSE